MGEAVQQRPGEAVRAEDPGPLVEEEVDGGPGCSIARTHPRLEYLKYGILCCCPAIVSP